MRTSQIWQREFSIALNTVTMTALATQRYMHKYGTTEEQYANVVVRARRNALNNPSAHLKGAIDIEAVLKSPRISWPYKLFDICPRSAGAAMAEVLQIAAAHNVPVSGLADYGEPERYPRLARRRSRLSA